MLFPPLPLPLVGLYALILRTLNPQVKLISSVKQLYFWIYCWTWTRAATDGAGGREAGAAAEYGSVSGTSGSVSLTSGSGSRVSISAAGAATNKKIALFFQGLVQSFQGIYRN
jgi:hypothetical protein